MAVPGICGRQSLYIKDPTARVTTEKIRPKIVPLIYFITVSLVLYQP
jgi:hypothetical protein